MVKTATLGIAVISLLLSAGTQAQQNTNDIVETAIRPISRHRTASST